MKNTKIICGTMIIVGILMISIVLGLQSEGSFTKITNYEEIDIRNVATSAKMTTKKENKVAIAIEETEMEIAPASVAREEVYDGLTLDELGEKFDRLLSKSYMAGKGRLIAETSLNQGVDPYIALAIILHETGCGSSCSRLTVQCNNVGGQKGSPGCNGGAYKSYATLDEGIEGFVRNLNKNYFSMGLTTIDAIAPKYAEGTTWAGKIHYFVEKIRNS